jgi:hypothetical protein
MMLRRLRPRSLYDVLAALAFFGVLTGGAAYAANTIGSSDIIDESILSRDVKNGQVGTPDLATDAVRTAKVLDESLTGHDIQDNTIGGADVNESLLDPVRNVAANAITAPKVLDESLTGHDIQDDTIGGADVNESLLDGAAYSPAFATHNPVPFKLPASSYAQVIYTGDGVHGDPLIHVPVPSIVMASASLNLESGARLAEVFCELGLVQPGGSRISFGQVFSENIEPTGRLGLMSLTGGLDVPNPGDYYVNVVCKSSGSVDSRATFTGGSLIAWAT